MILNLLSNAKDALVQYDDKVLKVSIRSYLKEEGKGIGIGLYMSKTIIENNMMGKLSVRNSEEGACFTITVGSASQEGREHEKQIRAF